jgi:hypothetical protein
MRGWPGRSADILAGAPETNVHCKWRAMKWLASGSRKVTVRCLMPYKAFSSFEVSQLILSPLIGWDMLGNDHRFAMVPEVPER